MIVVIIGTRAQLIKMAPVMIEMEQRKLPFQFVLTGQHHHTIETLIKDFQLTTNPTYLYTGKEVDSIPRVPMWVIQNIYKFLKIKDSLLGNTENTNHYFLIHGDTFSTLLGAILAKLSGSKSVHVEAGLRSFNLLQPFPEEITRIITFKLSNIAFCPGDYSFDNMAKYNIERINTIHNTLLDATRFVLKNSNDYEKPDRYCVCSIHRFENVFFKKRLSKILDMINLVSTKVNVKFVLHPSTRNNLIKYGFFDPLLINPSIEMMDRMSYTDFIQLINKSDFVITDGGSNQEELYYMGKPTLIFRSHTERKEGLSTTAVLSKFDREIVLEFLKNYSKYKNSNKLIDEPTSPSRIIVNKLEEIISKISS